MFWYCMLCNIISGCEVNQQLLLSRVAEPLCCIGTGVAALCCLHNSDKSWGFNKYSMTAVSRVVNSLSHITELWTSTFMNKLLRSCLLIQNTGHHVSPRGKLAWIGPSNVPVFSRSDHCCNEKLSSETVHLLERNRQYKYFIDGLESYWLIW